LRRFIFYKIEDAQFDEMAFDVEKFRASSAERKNPKKKFFISWDVSRSRFYWRG